MLQRAAAAVLVRPLVLCPTAGDCAQPQRANPAAGCHAGLNGSTHAAVCRELAPAAAAKLRLQQGGARSHLWLARLLPGGRWLWCHIADVSQRPAAAAVGSDARQERAQQHGMHGPHLRLLAGAASAGLPRPSCTFSSAPRVPARAAAIRPPLAESRGPAANAAASTRAPPLRSRFSGSSYCAIFCGMLWARRTAAASRGERCGAGQVRRRSSVARISCYRLLQALVRSRNGHGQGWAGHGRRDVRRLSNFVQN